MVVVVLSYSNKGKLQTEALHRVSGLPFPKPHILFSCSGLFKGPASWISAWHSSPPLFCCLLPWVVSSVMDWNGGTWYVGEINGGLVQHNGHLWMGVYVVINKRRGCWETGDRWVGWGVSCGQLEAGLVKGEPLGRAKDALGFVR